MFRWLSRNYDIITAVLVTMLGVWAAWHMVGLGWAAVVAVVAVVTGLLTWGWDKTVYRRYDRRLNRFLRRATTDDTLEQVLDTWIREGRERHDSR
jgi:Flp pilus assembly protein TadB